MNAIKTIADILQEHSFFQGLSPEDLAFIAGCGKNVHFQEGQVIASSGDAANEFYLLRDGQVALSIGAPPRKPFIFQTLGVNEIVGLSWLIPPYQWTASAQAQCATRAIAIDGACLRKKCENDPRLGFKLMKHLVQVMVMRENAVLLHLLDVYGDNK
ncbi:MAG: cyclic nucleotide-binding domain-containing protein [Chlamydiae bacterium]|nr:cyclic nucleotide-binding domain-containing protein [Chlamydiota bacterium]